MERASGWWWSKKFKNVLVYWSVGVRELNCKSTPVRQHPNTFILFPYEQTFPLHYLLPSHVKHRFFG